MAALRIVKKWLVNNVPTNPTSITLGIVRNDTGAVVVPAGTPMPLAPWASVGVFRYEADVDGSTTYTATITVLSNGQPYVSELVALPEFTPRSLCWPHGIHIVLNQMISLMAMITLSPNPDYSIHGESVSQASYLETLGRQIEQLTKLRAQAMPFEIVSRG